MGAHSVEFIQSLYAAFGRGDVDTIIAGCAPDVDWCEVGRRSDFAGYGQRRGHAEVRDFFATLGRDLDFHAFEPREFHVSGDNVFVLGHSAIQARATGRRADTDWAHVFTLKDGKVCRFRDFSDTAQVAEALRA